MVKQDFRSHICILKYKVIFSILNYSQNKQGDIGDIDLIFCAHRSFTNILNFLTAGHLMICLISSEP